LIIICNFQKETTLGHNPAEIHRFSEMLSIFHAWRIRRCVHFFHFTHFSNATAKFKYQFRAISHVMNMNAFDREFWNGALKALIMAERDLRKLLGEADAGEKEGIKVAIARVREMKESIETLHGNSVMKAMREIELAEQI